MLKNTGIPKRCEGSVKKDHMKICDKCGGFDPSHCDNCRSWNTFILDESPDYETAKDYTDRLTKYNDKLKSLNKDLFTEDDYINGELI